MSLSADQMLAELLWDYALGSLHWVGEELIFDRNYFRRSPDEAYRNYFDELKVMAETADFDVLALLDLVKGFGRSVRQTSPAQPVIDWFFEEGGRWVTLGSDAHEPQHVGHEFQAALQLAQAAGFAAAARYRTRRPSLTDG